MAKPRGTVVRRRALVRGTRWGPQRRTRRRTALGLSVAPPCPTRAVTCPSAEAAAVLPKHTNILFLVLVLFQLVFPYKLELVVDPDLRVRLDKEILVETVTSDLQV